MPKHAWTANGDLATSMGLRPGTNLLVESISEISIPEALSGTADDAVDQSLPTKTTLAPVLEMR
jgi:hypothetical protein